MHDYKNDEVVTMQLLEAIFAHCDCFTIFYCSFTWMDDSKVQASQFTIK